MPSRPVAAGVYFTAGRAGALEHSGETAPFDDKQIWQDTNLTVYGVDVVKSGRGCCFAQSLSSLLRRPVEAFK